MIKEINKQMIKGSEEKFPQRKVVIGNGRINAKIMLIGEAPGAEEEKQGLPFVGSAGKNLSQFLEILNLDRSEIYISNVVKIRPFKINEKTGNKVNRPPNREELEYFIPFLKREIAAVSPEITVTLGNTALRAVLGENKAIIGDYHGKTTEKGGIKLFALYHPASIIYNRSLKDTYLEDLEKLKAIIN